MATPAQQTNSAATSLATAYGAADVPAKAPAANGLLVARQGTNVSTNTVVYGFWYRPIGGNPVFFELPLAPQEITEDEPASTAIIPTLGAGKFVERRGSIFKNITLSGTFGQWAGSKNTINVTNGTQQAVTESDSAFYKFQELREFFRNYQKQFTDGGANHEQSYMVWTNSKDVESFVVEPLSFRLQRRRAFMYHYQIELRVLGLYKADPPAPTAKETRLSAAEYAAKVQAALTAEIAAAKERLSRVGTPPETAAPSAGGSNAQGQGSVPKEQTSSLLSRAKKLATDTQNALQFGTAAAVGAVTGPVGDLINLSFSGINAVAADYSLPFSVANSALNTISGLVGALRYGTRLFNGEYINAQSDLLTGQSVLTADAGKELLRAWGLDPSIVPGGTQSPTYNNTTTTGTTQYLTTGGQTLTVSTGQPATPLDAVPTNPAASPVLPSLPSGSITDTRHETVLPGETGEAFASRVAGTPTAWSLIVLLNKLKPPYFTNGIERLPNTVRPGDILIIPVFGGNPNVNKVDLSDTPDNVSFLVEASGVSGNTITVTGSPGWRPGNWEGYLLVRSSTQEEYGIVSSGADTLQVSEYAVYSSPLQVGELFEVKSVSPNSSTYDLSNAAAVRAMGVDLKLQRVLPPTYGGENEIVDLALGGGDDIGLIQGADNFLQAVGIKLRSRYGDLPLHTSGSDSFGLSVPIGSKASGSTLFQLSTDIRNSLEADPRVSAVKNISMMVDRDVVSVSLDVQPVGSKLFTGISGRIV